MRERVFVIRRARRRDRDAGAVQPPCVGSYSYQRKSHDRRHVKPAGDADSPPLADCGGQRVEQLGPVECDVLQRVRMSKPPDHAATPKASTASTHGG